LFSSGLLGSKTLSTVMWIARIVARDSSSAWRVGTELALVLELALALSLCFVLALSLCDIGGHAADAHRSSFGVDEREFHG